jgi:formylglycine-generating enzyme required for sulfatase activity
MLSQQKRLHTVHAMAITAHVCDALAYAHERGIIHRDIKPANIMFGYDGVVKVADFGLAKMTHSQNSGLTQSGMAMGTLHYMAPEALMLGSAVDHRADIYAVGVMLYQMLTGKIPQGLFELPSLQVPGLDPRYDSIIGKALREDRELRYPRVLDMRHDLDAILTQPVVRVEAAAEKAPAALQTQARPQRPGGQPYRLPASQPQPAPSRSSSGGMLAVVMLLILAGAAAFFYFRSNDRVEAVSSTMPPAGTGDWIDLLPLVDPQTGTVSGKWTRVADGLHGERLPDTKGAQVFQLPYEPPEEYDFRVAYTTMEGNAEISQLLSAFDRQFTWGTASGQPEKWSGFNMVKGKPMMLSGAGVKLPARRELNRRYESLVEVRRDRVTGYVDGEKLVEWKTDYSDFSADPEHTLPNARALGVGICWSKTVFHDISVREVTGTGKRLSPPPTVATRSSPPSGDPAKATKDQPFVNSLGMKFVPVPGTDVLFCIHETTRADYASYAAQTANVDESWKNPNYQGIPVSSGDDHPVCNVSWEDAKSFCAWLGRKEGLIYRLPTDREWSAAVGIADSEPAGKTPVDLHLMQLESGVYPWGTEWPPPKGAGNFSDINASQAFPADTLISFIEGYSDEYAVTSPVMSFKPNALGLFDLAGNVYELCEDWTDETKQHRVVRGTSWKGSLARGLLSSNRGGHRPTARIDHHGFRVVIERPMNPAALKAEAPAAPAQQTAALPSGPTTWTDTKGRSLTATFKAIASGSVLLDIAGKVTPVPMNTLSAESQKLARNLDAAQKLADAIDPAKATKDQPFVNTLGMKFVPVTGTQVLFCIHETRKADYAAFFAATPGVPAFWQNPSYEGAPVSFADDHPVCNIRWQDCQDFCQWLSRKEGRTYRLPTDSEWSFAVGIGDREDASLSPHLLSDRLTGEFPWGKEWPPPAGAGNLGDSTMAAKFPKKRAIPGYTDGFATTAPVMSFSPNRYGLFDLSGNVWEFCQDWYDETRTKYVIRGLNFDDSGESSVRFLSSHRGLCPVGNRHSNFGFRVVLERPAETDAANASGASAPAASGGGDSREDPAMAELLAFERTLRSHTWLISDRNWELRFENDHRAPIDERVYTTRWHWWITGPRSLHIQFASAPPAYDPNIGVEYIFDKNMKTFTTGKGKTTGVRQSSLGVPNEADLGKSFAPDYAKKLSGSLRPQFPSK